MATDLEISNRALSRVGGNRMVAFPESTTKQGRAIGDAYDKVRKEVLRAAPWGCVEQRKTIAETSLTNAVSAVSVGAGPTYAVTVTITAHGLVELDRFRIENALGMTQLNTIWRAHFIDANNIQLLHAGDALTQSGQGWTAWTSGGTVYRVPDWDWDRQYTIPSNCLRVLSVNGQQDGDDWSVESALLLTDLTSPISIRYVRDETTVTLFDSLLVNTFAARLAAEVCEELTQDGAKRDRAWAEYNRHLATARAVNGREQTPEDFEESSYLTARY